jgi:hypothetical protein
MVPCPPDVTCTPTSELEGERDARGASKKISRDVVLCVRRLNGAFPVATTVMGPGRVCVPLKVVR